MMTVLAGSIRMKARWRVLRVKTCTKGQYAVDSSTACKACCETGKYQELDVATEHECKFCAKGKGFVNSQSNCSACVDGEYQDESTLAGASCQTCTKASMLWTAAQPARHAKLESTKS